MEKMQNINQINTLFMIQNTLSTWNSKHFFATIWLKKLYYTAFMLTVEEITTYALGEHDPGSAQNGRTSNKNVEPCSYYFFHGSASHFIFSLLKGSSYDSVWCATFSWYFWGFVMEITFEMDENYLPQGRVALKEKLLSVYSREHTQNSLNNDSDFKTWFYSCDFLGFNWLSFVRIWAEYYISFPC